MGYKGLCSIGVDRDADSLLLDTGGVMKEDKNKPENDGWTTTIISIAIICAFLLGCLGRCDSF